MFKIEDELMTVIQGDTALFDIRLDNYEFVNGDVVYFTIKKNISDSVNKLQKVVNSFKNGVAQISLSSADTNLIPGNYYYDIEVNLADGRIDTIIGPAKFKVLSGVK